MGFNSKPAVLLYWEAIFYWMSFSKRPMLYCELHVRSGLQIENGNSLYVISGTIIQAFTLFLAACM